VDKKENSMSGRYNTIRNRILQASIALLQSFVRENTSQENPQPISSLPYNDLRVRRHNRSYRITIPHDYVVKHDVHWGDPVIWTEQDDCVVLKFPKPAQSIEWHPTDRPKPRWWETDPSPYAAWLRGETSQIAAE
jgi:hypothetical protein